MDVGEQDIITSFNSHAAVDWYFGTDGNTPSRRRDFVSVVLHEIGHGLGFISFATVDVFEIEHLFLDLYLLLTGASLAAAIPNYLRFTIFL